MLEIKVIEMYCETVYIWTIQQYEILLVKKKWNLLSKLFALGTVIGIFISFILFNTFKDPLS